MSSAAFDPTDRKENAGRTDTPRKYVVYGLVIETDLDVPEWRGTDTADVDVTVLRGQVPKALRGATTRTEFWQARPGEILLQIEMAGRFLIRNGREIVFDQAPGAGDGDVVAFLVSSALAAILHQRGLTVIHASVAEIDGRGVFMFGSSGAGKSTTMAALTRRGARLVSDDQLVATPYAAGLAALSGPNVTRLWSDATRALDMRDVTPIKYRAGEAKHAVALPAFAGDPLPISLGVQLFARQGAPVEAESMTPRESFELLWRYCFRRRYAEAMGLQGQIFQVASGLSAQVPVYRVTRPVERFTADEVATTILDLLETDAT